MCRQRFKKYSNAMGKDATIHKLRHSHISTISRDSTLNRKAIADRVDHKSTKVTEQYTHSYNDQREEIVASISKILS